MQSQRKGLSPRDPTDAVLSSHESLTNTLPQEGFDAAGSRRNGNLPLY